jgi:hypothetical protein
MNATTRPFARGSRAYRDAGATRLVMFSQKSAAEIADGAAPRWIEKTRPVVEAARATPQ